MRCAHCDQKLPWWTSFTRGGVIGGLWCPKCREYSYFDSASVSQRALRFGMFFLLLYGVGVTFAVLGNFPTYSIVLLIAGAVGLGTYSGISQYRRSAPAALSPENPSGPGSESSRISGAIIALAGLAYVTLTYPVHVIEGFVLVLAMILSSSFGGALGRRLKEKSAKA